MESEIKNFLDNLEKNEHTINLYTINKKQNVKILEKKYLIKFATIKGESKDYIKNTIKKFLVDNLEKINQTQDYFDFNITDGDFYLTLNADKVNEFEVIHNKMKSKTQLDSLEKLTDKTTCLVIEVLINEVQYLFFQKTNISPKIKKKLTSLIFRDGIFDKIIEPKSQELEFLPYFHFVYFNKRRKFLILNKIKFEQNFDFRKFYEANSKKALEELESKKFIFSKELKEGLLIQPRYMTKFTKLLLCKGLENLEKRDFLPYEKEFGIKINKDENGDIIINDLDDLDGLIKILQKECVIEISTKEKFFSKSKVRFILNKIGNVFK